MANDEGLEWVRMSSVALRLANAGRVAVRNVVVLTLLNAGVRAMLTDAYVRCRNDAANVLRMSVTVIVSVPKRFRNLLVNGVSLVVVGLVCLRAASARNVTLISTLVRCRVNVGLVVTS